MRTQAARQGLQPCTINRHTPPPPPSPCTGTRARRGGSLNTLTLIKSTGATTGGRPAVAESRAPRGPAAPLHVHHREAEFFAVIEGELTVGVGGELIEAPEGSLVYGPPDVPHTFAITSDQARFLVLTQPASRSSARPVS